MRISICDDDIEFLKQFKIYFERYVEKNKENIQLVSFKSGAQFLDYFQQFGDIAIVFLDIRMEILDGMKTAQKLRKMDKKVKIIFLTSIGDYAIDGYLVNACGYIMKPLHYETLASELKKAITAVHQEDSSYYVEKNDNGFFKVYYDDIIYIETIGRNTLIHTEKSNVLSYRTMKVHENSLDQRFIRTHISYIINMAYIDYAHKLEVKMKNGEFLPIAQLRRKQFYKKLSQYYISLLDG